MSEQTFDVGVDDRDPFGGVLVDDGAGPSDGGEAADRLLGELTATARAQAAVVTAHTAALVDAVVALRPLEGRMGVTWRQWVAWQLGLTTGEARRICALAERLPTLPLIDAAFRAGELSEGVAEVLVRVATPHNEAEVLAAASVATGAQLQQLARDYRHVRDTDKPRRRDEDAIDPGDAASEASWAWDDDGRFRGSWNLRAEAGATVEAALEAALAHLRPCEADIDGAHPQRAGGGGGSVVDEPDAAEHDSVAGAAGAAGAAGVVEGELRPEERAAARHCDALVGLAQRYLTGEAHDGVVPESTQVIVHRPITPAELAALPDLRRAVQARLHENGGGEPAGTASAVPAPERGGSVLPGPLVAGCGTVPAWVATYLACGALTVTVGMVEGFPASQPTAVRSFGRQQRRALRARDRHCRFPGCTRTRHLHVHHTHEWARTQRSTVAHGLLLCQQHHALVHRLTYRIELGTDHSVTVTRSDGSILRSTPLPPPRAPDLRRAVAASAARPTRPRRTGTGERLDHYARDVLATHWHLTDLHNRPPDDPDPP